MEPISNAGKRKPTQGKIKINMKHLLDCKTCSITHAQTHTNTHTTCVTLWAYTSSVVQKLKKRLIDRWSNWSVTIKSTSSKTGSKNSCIRDDLRPRSLSQPRGLHTITVTGKKQKQKASRAPHNISTAGIQMCRYYCTGPTINYYPTLVCSDAFCSRGLTHVSLAVKIHVHKKDSESSFSCR